MSAESKIEWTDHTASPWHGCSHGVYLDAQGNEHEHLGCMNCYAELGAKRNPGTLGVWGTEGTRVMSTSFHKNCIRWNKEAERDGVIRSVFPSICDPFEDWDGPILNAKGQTLARIKNDKGDWLIGERLNEFEPMLTMKDLRRDLFATIEACPHLRFLLLTKRPGNVRKMWPPSVPPQENLFNVFASFQNSIPASKRAGMSYYRKNVALITSISDQATADAMIPLLLECRDLVPTLGVSYEPAIGPVDFFYGPNDWGLLTGLNWVIIGGESGHNARPFDIAWARSVIEQCKAAGVPVFMKQLGNKPIWNHVVPGCSVREAMEAWPTNDPKGGAMDEWPEDLRIREMPETRKLVPA